MNQPPAIDPSMMSHSGEVPSLIGPDDSSRDHESKGLFSDFPHNAFGGKGPTENDACKYLTTTKKVAEPTDQEIKAMVLQMTTLHKNISDSGGVLIKSKFGELAENRNMKFGKDDSQTVSSFSQMKESFRDPPTYGKCELVFGIIYTWPSASEEGKLWLDHQVRILKEMFKLHYPDVPGCFVRQVLETKSLQNVRNHFQFKDGCTGKGSRSADTSIGLTIKRSQDHSMGKAKSGHPTYEFIPQNIKGWDYLVKRCPVARKMQLLQETGGKKQGLQGFPTITTPATMMNTNLSVFARHDRTGDGTTNFSTCELKAAHVSVGSSRDFTRRFPVQVQENFPDCGGVFGDRIGRVEPPNSVVMASTTATEVSSLKGSQAEVI